MNIDSDDPFEILGLTEATTDQKVIKRAYKRMALRYHPDVISTPKSSPEEKKEASDRFAKINWAYSQLSGKGEDNKTYNTTPTGQKKSDKGGWTPPHRRSSGNQQGSRSYASGSNSKQSVDWSDFMPKSDDSYDTDGDSFGKIFSDLFAGGATGTVSGAAGSTLFKDFIEFLEGNVDGFGGATGGSDDSELWYLLERGTKQEIRNELDDTKLVVDQLARKLRGIENEIDSATAGLSETEKYLEKIRLEEIIAELSARKNVVKGYLQKAEQRLLRLQIRYKELKTSNSQWEEIKQESASSTRDSSTASQESSSTRVKDDDKKQSWKKEGFGSSARRGSRRRQSTESKTKKPAEPVNLNSSENMRSNVDSERSWRTQGYGSSRRSSRQDRATRSQHSSATNAKPDRADRDPSRRSRKSATSATAPNPSTESVPPHRRTASRNTQDDSEKRLREIIVDEEFEKLKRELGL